MMPDSGSAVRELKECGFSQHERGDLEGAERSYRTLLLAAPDDLEVLHALGILAVQTGRYGEAAEAIARVVRNGGSARAHADLGNALCGLGRFEEAAVSFERALALNADLADAHVNRGYALQALGRPLEALASYERAIALEPKQPELRLKAASTLAELRRWEEALARVDQAIERGAGSAEAHTLRGLAEAGLGRVEGALESYRRALELDPRYVPGYVNRGILLGRGGGEGGRPEQALADYEAALLLQADSFEALANRAALLNRLNRFAEALQDSERAAAARPDRPEVHLHRANALLGLDRFEEALECAERVIASHPQHAEVHACRAAALQYLERHGEALSSAERAIELAPELAAGHFNRASALRDSMRIEEAIAGFETARSLTPEDATTNCNLGGLYLLQGRYQRGFELYEWRSKLPGAPKVHRFDRPPWRGESELRSKTLFAYLDQGLGDTLQFARYAKLAESRGARVVMSVQGKLRRLLSTLGPTIELLSERETPAAFDLHCPLASLPRAFGTTLSTVPAEVPYLAAEPERIAEWTRRLGDGGFKIGICWRGSTHRGGGGRAFPLGALRPFAALPGVRLISLQRGSGIEELSTLPESMPVETLGEDFDRGPDAFLDTAAVMHALDLVITCDTSIAHVAGALARPAWVAVKRVPDWRWMLDRDDNPWYPTLRVFRQRRAGSWSEVFDAMERALRHRLEGGPTSC